MTEMSENNREGSTGSARVAVYLHQAVPATIGVTADSEMITMEQVLCRTNMLIAYHRVIANKGAPGVDGVTVGELKGYLCKHWVRIREEILSENYVPQPVRKVEIGKPDGGGMRMLGIPTTTDRLIQQALLQVLQLVFDRQFSESSFGFRPGRSAHQAVESARGHMASGYRWVVDLDLEKFFDRVNHDILMSRLARRIKDKSILRLIRRYLEVGMMEHGVVSPREEGTPQGGPLSPLLSNVLLDELDKELEHRGHRFVRYADDCNIYVCSRRAGARVLDSLVGFLQNKLRLVVNRQKSAVDRPWKRAFLGYTVTIHRVPKLRVAPKSVQRLKDKLRLLFRQGRGRNIGKSIEAMTPVLGGWLNYFRLAEVKSCFEELDMWLRRRLRCILWRQWKRPWIRTRELMKRGLSEKRACSAAFNGRGPWWNAGASHMNEAVPIRWLEGLGLYSLLENYQRMKCVT